MVYKFLFFPALLATGLLLSANAAHAQRGGGGRGGGGGAAHAGGAYHAGGYGGAYNHGGYYHNGYGYGYGGIGIGIGLGGYGYGYGYPYAYPYDYPIIVPRAAYYPPIVGQLPPNDPPLPLNTQPPAPTSGAANVRVLVPDGQAKVFFDGNPTTQGGTDRLFHTPTLSGAGPYSYRIRATWMQNGKEMTQEFAAQVSPGQTTTVDFTRPASEPVPLPK
jgi:uncharacterized protein (TIGR03000 family)